MAYKAKYIYYLALEEKVFDLCCIWQVLKHLQLIYLCLELYMGANGGRMKAQYHLPCPGYHTSNDVAGD